MPLFYRTISVPAFLRVIVLIWVATAGTWSTAAAQADEPSSPPPVAREFRGVWVATVQNIDWPSKPGLPAGRQKRELIAILDKAVELNLNAVIFQIRPAADALYPSKLEPWSEYLTGRMGQPPKPFYDPLKFAVEQAHRRGLQLHVWFNPYRVRVGGARRPASVNHTSLAHPEIVREYGQYLWFDPGEPAAVDHFIAVLNDVVKRYDIDGVHIDDYFYPYQIKGKDGKIVPFPDDESYQRAVAAGETLERDDWRRQNVDRLIQRMYEDVKRAKPWVLVGISPFGIWRPGHPEGIVGLDQYSSLYADARKWYREGWVDYFTPQLYWQVESKGQSYPRLLGWWHEQNLKQRHLWPGNFTSKVRRRPEAPETRDSWSAAELIRQIEATRAQPGATGNVHFSMKALQQNYDGIADKLKADLYAEPALVPESKWLGDETPPAPEVVARRNSKGVVVAMKTNGQPGASATGSVGTAGAGSGDPRTTAPGDPRTTARADPCTTAPRDPRTTPWQWVVRVQTGDGWKTEIVPGRENRHVVTLPENAKATQVAVSAVTRLSREGPATRAEIEDRD